MRPLSTSIRFLIPITVVLLLGFLYALNEETSLQQQQITTSATKQAQDLSLLLTTTESSVGDQVKSSMALLLQRGQALGTAHQEGQVEVGVLTVPNLYLGQLSQANRPELVDGVKTIMGGTATIFVKSGDRFVRIATNVESDKGVRGIGTFLDPEGKAIKSLRQGQPFYGVVDVLGAPYITGYEPMQNNQGEVVGAWYVGYKADLNSISQIVSKSRFLNSGFQAVLDYRGNVRFHSEHLSKEAIEKLIKAHPTNWQFVYSEIPEWGYKVLTAYPKQEALLHGLKAVLHHFVFGAVFLTLLLGLIFRQMRQLIYRPLGADPDVAAKMVRRISTGDLSGDDHKAPVGSLMDDLSVMRANLQGMLTTINKNAQDLGLAASVFSQSHNCVIITDLQSNIIDVNPAFTNLTGYSHDEVIGRNTSILKSGRHDARFYEEMWASIKATGSWSGEVWDRRKNGEEFLESLYIKAVHGTDGNISHYVGISTNITDRKLAEEENQLATLVYQNSTEAITVTDENNRIVAINPAFTNITGYTEAEALGQNPKFLSSGRQGPEFYRDMWEALNNTGHWQGEIWNKKKNGEEFVEWLSINTIYNKDGTVHRRVALFLDITDRKNAEAEVLEHANFDHLTRLPNRRLFHDRLEQEIRKAQRDKTLTALLFLDLDRFKEVNDSLGHDMGDLLLVEAATRIKHCVRECDTLARLGGDEFTVILSELQNPSNIERIATSIIESLAEPFLLNGQESFVSVSIGIALYPDDATGINDLIKHADQAMYAAKDYGRGRFHFFTKALQEAVELRMRLGSDLRNALHASQFEVYYQPIIELDSGHIHKAEALLRWKHPIHGFVSPAAFIPIAEDTGTIHEIGDWVFLQAAHQVRHWQSIKGSAFQISVNKSPVQFLGDDKNHNYWVEKLAELGLPGSCIVVEITEGLLMNTDTNITKKLLRFREAGIQFAIDDFGTGYSALSYLKKFDIDYLKIDQSFTRNLAPNTPDFALCEAMVVMAHKLGIKVIAEGVETEQQQDLLIQIGCDYGQGYLFSKPVPAEDFETLLLKG